MFTSKGGGVAHTVVYCSETKGGGWANCKNCKRKQGELRRQRHIVRGVEHVGSYFLCFSVSADSDRYQCLYTARSIPTPLMNIGNLLLPAGDRGCPQTSSTNSWTKASRDDQALSWIYNVLLWQRFLWNYHQLVDALVLRMTVSKYSMFSLRSFRFEGARFRALYKMPF